MPSSAEKCVFGEHSVRLGCLSRELEWRPPQRPPASRAADVALVFTHSKCLTRDRGLDSNTVIASTAQVHNLIVWRSSFRGARGLCFEVSVAIVPMMACFFDAKGPPPASNDRTAKSGRFLYILFNGDERGPRSAHTLACINTMTGCLALLYTSRCASFGHACASAPAPAPAPERCVLGPRQEQDQHCHTLDASPKSERCC